MIDWGTIYNRHLARGDDHGYAAFAADQWEARMNRKTADKKLAAAIDKIGAEPLHKVVVGNLYPSKGGRDTRFWYVISIKRSTSRIRGDRAILLGLDEDWNIVSSQTYAVHALEERELLGHYPLSEVSFSDDI